MMQLPGRGSLLRPGAPLLRQAREFEDAVQRSTWSTAVFSHDSEHVATVSQVHLQNRATLSCTVSHASCSQL